MATYTDSHPGKYKLMIYTTNNDRGWGEQAAEMTIVISLPLWVAVLTYMLYILIIGGVIYLSFKAYGKKRLKKQFEQETLKREQRKEELN